MSLEDLYNNIETTFHQFHVAVLQKEKPDAGEYLQALKDTCATFKDEVKGRPELGQLDDEKQRLENEMKIEKKEQEREKISRRLFELEGTIELATWLEIELEMMRKTVEREQNLKDAQKSAVDPFEVIEFLERFQDKFKRKRYKVKWLAYLKETLATYTEYFHEMVFHTERKKSEIDVLLDTPDTDERNKKIQKIRRKLKIYKNLRDLTREYTSLLAKSINSVFLSEEEMTKLLDMHHEIRKLATSSSSSGGGSSRN